jgi:hypothetical protein
MSGKQESFYQKLKFELEDFNFYPSQGELIETPITLKKNLLHPVNT